MISLNSMSLEEKIGQLFMVRYEGIEQNAQLIKLIQKYKIGGVLLNPKGVEKVGELYNFIDSLKGYNSGNQVPLFIAVEQEGGNFNKMPLELRRLPSAKASSSIGNKNLLYELGNITGEMLRKVGFNMNLAPVLDIDDSKNSNFIADRSFSSNPNIVASYGSVNMKGMNEQNIITAVKHFPGQGSVTMDSHSIIIPYTKKTLQKLEESDILPFREVMKNGADCMMVGHINLTKFNLFAPATTSTKVISGLVRGKYKYDGVLMTDDLGMPCMDIQYGLKDATKRAIIAGNDILMIKDMSRAESTIDYIIKIVNKEKISSDRIDQSVNRILNLKEKYASESAPLTSSDVEEINRKIENITNQIEL